MKKILELVRVYELENNYKGFIVEVLNKTKNESPDFKEFWLYHENYGIKSLMFGCNVKENDIIDMIKYNINSHIELYKKEYMEV